MPAKMTLTMRQLRQVLRLASARTSMREIGRLTGVARSTVQDALKRAQAAKVSWPLASAWRRSIEQQPARSNVLHRKALALWSLTRYHSLIIVR